MNGALWIYWRCGIAALIPLADDRVTNGAGTANQHIRLNQVFVRYVLLIVRFLHSVTVCLWSGMLSLFDLFNSPNPQTRSLNLVWLCVCWLDVVEKNFTSLFLWLSRNTAIRLSTMINAHTAQSAIKNPSLLHSAKGGMERQRKRKQGFFQVKCQKPHI